MSKTVLPSDLAGGTPALGIDIGADGIHICPAPQPGDPKTWVVHFLDFKEQPDWWQWLLNNIHDHTIIAAEPTGWHYLSPVANLVQQYTRAQLWLVEHSQTGKMRDLRVSKQKTDETDARALALIALDILMGNPPLGVWQHNQALENHVLNLRFHVNAYSKLNAESVRLQNRLRQLGHGMFPSLGMSRTWRTLIALGAVTPEQIHAFDLNQVNGHQARWIDQLRRDLPLIAVPAKVEQTARETHARLQQVEALLAAEHHTITQLVTTDPFAEVTHKLMTVPGAQVGWVAAIHVATHAEAHLMTEARFCACLGIYPQIKASGSTNKHKSTKKGYRPAMNALYFWTMTLISSKSAPIPNPIHTYFGGGEKNGGRKFVSARAKLAAILSGVARSSSGYVDQEPKS